MPFGQENQGQKTRRHRPHPHHGDPPPLRLSQRIMVKLCLPETLECGRGDPSGQGLFLAICNCSAPHPHFFCITGLNCDQLGTRRLPCWCHYLNPSNFPTLRTICKDPGIVFPPFRKNLEEGGGTQCPKLHMESANSGFRTVTWVLENLRKLFSENSVTPCPRKLRPENWHRRCGGSIPPRREARPGQFFYWPTQVRSQNGVAIGV